MRKGAGGREKEAERDEGRVGGSGEERERERAGGGESERALERAGGGGR